MDILASLKYLLGQDVNGNEAALARLTSGQRGILVFDGDDTYFATGADDKPILLPSLKNFGPVEDTQMVGIVGILGSGRIVNWVGKNDKKRALVSEAGVCYWADLGVTSLPTTGFGILIKPDADSDAAYINTPGIPFFKDDNTYVPIPTGTEGQQLVVKSGIPTFVNVTPGTVSSGISFTGLDGVVGKNTSAAVVNVQAPSFTLTDGSGDELTVSNVNVNADVSAAVGEGGIDAGAEDTNKWYYVYIISDGTTASAIISLNGSTPDLSGTTGPYTHYALASVFRNDAGGNIVNFRQKGRRFVIDPQTYGNNIAITTAFAAVPGTVNLNTLVPPPVKSITGNVGGSTTETSARSLIMATTASGIGSQYIGAKQGGADLGNFSFDVGPFDLIVDDPASPTLYWKSFVNSGRRRLEVNGYRI